MRVVHQHRHRRLLRVSREQAERRGPDSEPILRGRRAQRERGLERRRLGLRDPVEGGQRGAQ